MIEEVVAVGGNRKNTIKIYDEVEKPLGVVLIIHGMQEHSGRYEWFCSKLNKAGYIAVTSDLRGHGKNMVISRPGYSDGNIFDEIVTDQKAYIKYLKNKYKKLPLFVFGHSFGSFVTQRLLTESDADVDKFILCGTGYAKSPAFFFGNLVAKITEDCMGRGADAKLIEKLSFKQYEKKFKNGNWLSRDDRVWKKYHEDVLCGCTFPACFYSSFFGSARKNYKNLAVVDESTPILVISGTKDPVGEYGKGVNKLLKVYRNHWLNVYAKLYTGARHELLNETNKDEVVKDIIDFLKADNKKINNR